jgi:hypothetical protein
MAKVENQDIPAQEVLYDPDAARPYTLGEAYQQAITEGHTGQTQTGELIVGKSPKGGRPPQRGPGTTAQAPQRECFKCCAEMWRNLPNYHKACVKEVYEEGQPAPHDHQIPPEWFSTPYSTFQKECLKKCREVGSCAFDPQEIFPCPNPECLNSTIGYTTNQMVVNENQQLIINNPAEGGNYQWAVASGGGSISGTGLYTAPSSNMNCNENPNITLSCLGQVIDSLEIAITNNSGQLAYLIKEVTNCHVTYAGPPPLYGCFVSIEGYTCDGTIIPACHVYGDDASYPSCDDVLGSCGWSIQGPCAAFGHSGVIDKRSDAQKLAGCCPAAVM